MRAMHDASCGDARLPKAMLRGMKTASTPLAVRLRAAMQNKGIDNQTELARQATRLSGRRVSPSSISRVLSGQSSHLSYSSLRAVALALACSPGELDPQIGDGNTELIFGAGNTVLALEQGTPAEYGNSAPRIVHQWTREQIELMQAFTAASDRGQRLIVEVAKAIAAAHPNPLHRVSTHRAGEEAVTAD